jgi:hypothetical protein
VLSGTRYILAGAAGEQSRSGLATTARIRTPYLPERLARKVQFLSKSGRSLYPQKRPFAALPRNDAMGH